MNKKSRVYVALSAAVALSLLGGSYSSATTLKQAIDKTLKTNPQILQAAKNREAVEFELRQARGLYLPSVDLEAGVGRREACQSLPRAD